MKNSSKPDTNDTCLSKSEITVIRNSINKIGVRETADKLGISRLSLANVVAELDVTRGTIAVIRQNLEKI